METRERHITQASPTGVADAEWRRVRDLGRRVDQLEAALAESSGDDELEMQLARARIRAQRAAARALLADSLADELASRGHAS